MQERKHIPSLDGLRGIAAAAVVFSHIDLIFPSLGHLMIGGIGGRAVAIFSLSLSLSLSLSAAS